MDFSSPVFPGRPHSLSWPRRFLFPRTLTKARAITSDKGQDDETVKRLERRRKEERDQFIASQCSSGHKGGQEQITKQAEISTAQA